MRRVVTFGVITALTLGVIAAVALGARTSRQAARDPGYCSRCHGAVAEHVSGHLEEPCQSCHVGPASAVGLALAAGLGLGEVPDHGAVDAGSCGSCHDALPGPARALVQATAGHRAHLDVEVACGACHDAGIHDPGATAAATCLECHRDTPMAAGPMAGDDCLGCHVFRADVGFLALGDAEDPAALPDPAATARLERVGWGGEVPADHAHGTADCRSCHNPHTSADPTGAGVAPACTTCHRGTLEVEVRAGPEGHARSCAGCHEVHAERTALATPCTDCHAPASTRPAANDGIAAWVTREGGVATPAQTRAVAAMTHGGACSTCHRPHQLDAAEDDCRVCHAEDAATLEALPAGTHGSCLGCHAPHAPPPTSTSCTSGCHAPIRSETVGGPTPHQTCLSCHDAHADKAVAVAACDGCHGALVGQPAAVHRGACLDCHAPHAAGAGPASSCGGCHGEIPTPVAAHRCNGCHRPHVRAELAITQCAGCHRGPLVAARSWAAGSPHASAGQCTSCHRAHEESSPAPCASCHAPQASKEHVGVHEGCVGCHAPHQPVPTEARGWEQRCASCHAVIAQDVFRARGVHATCQGCHETPGRPLPRCATCHGPTSLALSHRIPGHADARAGCASCHVGHSTAPPRRETCLGCHDAQRTDHFPDATTCLSCHPFAAPDG